MKLGCGPKHSLGHTLFRALPALLLKSFRSLLRIHLLREALPNAAPNSLTPSPPFFFFTICHNLKLINLTVVSPLQHELSEGMGCTMLTTVSLGLEQCLEPRRDSVNIWGENEWVNERTNELVLPNPCVFSFGQYSTPLKLSNTFGRIGSIRHALYALYPHTHHTPKSRAWSLERKNTATPEQTFHLDLW